jgi:hypothetical protein
VAAQQYAGQNPLQMMVRSTGINLPKGRRSGSLNLPLDSLFAGRGCLWQ